MDALKVIEAAGMWFAMPYIAPSLVSKSKMVRAESARIVAELLRDELADKLQILADGLHRLVAYDGRGLKPLAAIDAGAVRRLQTGRDEAWAVFGILSFHASGWVREAALDRLADVQDGKEIPFLLIRANDWVGPIAEKARALLAERLSARPVRQFSESLSLIFNLRERTRGHLSEILRQVTERVVREEAVDFLAELADVDRSVTRRRWILKLAIQSPRVEVEALIKRLLKDLDAPLRLAAWEREWAREPEQASINGLSDRSPVIRRRSLEVMGSAPGLVENGVFWRMLLDPSPSVRATAQYYLKGAGARDVVQFYREAVKAEATPRSGAIYGLGETGTDQDAEVLEVFLTHPRASHRRAAVTAIGSLDPVRRRHSLEQALFDPSSAVSKAACQRLRKQAEVIGRVFFCKMLGEAHPIHVRRNGLSLISALPKWERLIGLFEGFDQAPEFNDEIRLGVRRWLATYNRSWVKPDSSQVDLLKELVGRHQGLLVNWEFLELREILKSHEVVT